MAFDYVEIAEEGRFLPWGKVAAEKVDEMEHWIANADAMVVSTNPTAHTADKTYDEIISAITAGRTVIAKDNGNSYYSLVGYDNNTLDFVRVTESGSNRNFNRLSISKNNNYVLLQSYRFLPKVTTANNGSELIASDGAWVIQQKKFVVTLTPTSPDYSGTMDKKVSEINAAFEAGQKIVFRLVISADEYMDIDCTAIYTDSTAYPSFNGSIVSESIDSLVFAYTGTTNNGDKTTYSTAIYTLTPVSSGS